MNDYLRRGLDQKVEEPGWCDENFGPVYRADGRRRYSCRRPFGHEGPHGCASADSDGWVEPPLYEPPPPYVDPAPGLPLKRRGRSEAAKAVFGS